MLFICLAIAYNELLRLMKEKKDEPLSVLQGYEQTYSEAVKR